MNAICISFKGNIKCGSKITDVAKLPQKMAKKPKLNGINGEVERDSYIANRFHELGIGEPSRNVIEMIFRASCSSRRRSSKKIRRVVKVKNPEEVVAEFERYREEVMRSSLDHSRSVVDGNEVLQFYGTTMSCCCGRLRPLLSQLCTQPGCRVCRIIQSGFNTSYNKIHGIRLSSKSNSMSEDSAINGGAKNAKRAVIICRTIAAGGRGVGADGAMVLPNPAAILPCFLVIFD